MGDDVAIEKQAFEFAVAPSAMERSAVERGQGARVARTGVRQHGFAREQAADDPYHRRGRGAAGCGCAAGAGRLKGLRGAWAAPLGGAPPAQPTEGRWPRASART